MSLVPQALLDFELPAAPQRIDELPAAVVGAEAVRVHHPKLSRHNTTKPLWRLFDHSLDKRTVTPQSLLEVHMRS